MIMEKKEQGAKIVSIHQHSATRQPSYSGQKPTPKNAFEELLQYFYPEEFHQEPDCPDQRA